MKIQKFTSCFSREEFYSDFVRLKGDNKMKNTEVNFVQQLREILLGLCLIKRGY